MNSARTIIDPEVFAAFRAYEREERISKSRIGCILVVILMPLGSPMDYYNYRDQFWFFLFLRLLSALISGGFWALLGTNLGRRWSQWLGLMVPMVPVLFISWMIARVEGFASSYYAGLNVVLLAVGTVLNWTFIESLVSVSCVLVVYIAVGLYAMFVGGRGVTDGPVVNNFFFILCMDVIVVVGTYFQYKARLREFVLRYQLDRSSRALEESHQKLVELDQIKSRFFANISHELRTPLTLLIAPLENLMQRFRLDQSTRELLETMHANGMRLLKLINDLLDLVRLESGRMDVKKEAIDVPTFVKGLASAVQQMAENRQVQLQTCADPGMDFVLADRDKLEKIMLNLLFNALKFTPADGKVEIRAEKAGNELVLSVSDTGVGISEAHLPFVFDRFWQADTSSKRKFQGAGIGLALVKELAEIQGGTVSVESQEGKGATFMVRLPFEKAEPPPPKPDGAASDSPAGLPGDGVPPDPALKSEEWLANLYRRAELFPAMTSVRETVRRIDTALPGNEPVVLVADDEPDMLRFLKTQLNSHYRVHEAVDGQQAVEKATQFLPDLILLDMMMPEKDGLQACREIRAHTSTQATPIIMLTARADEETKMAALTAGASDFLPKPFSTTELHVRIKNLIESHQSQKRLSRQNQVLETTLDQLKETEIQLVQSEKMASLGRMSAGIIHEINNPLNYATTGLFALRNKRYNLAPQEREEYLEILRDVEEGIKRVRGIVSDLRMFSHPDTESRDQVEISEVVSAALRFLSSEWKERVSIEQSIPPHQTVWANKNMLIHVLVNLLQNSLDALKSKTFPDGEQPSILLEGRCDDSRSILILRDNGAGIPSEHLGKIFDPFFTTKDVGKGMGLGLAICYKIVQDYEGRIAVRTEPGKFCEFSLEFPRKGAK